MGGERLMGLGIDDSTRIVERWYLESRRKVSASARARLEEGTSLLPCADRSELLQAMTAAVCCAKLTHLHGVEMVLRVPVSRVALSLHVGQFVWIATAMREVAAKM